MKRGQPTNTAASIRQRLLNISREHGEEFQLVLIRYALERLLYRLTRSPHKDQFLLKGAMLFQLWTHEPHRSTLDLDLLGKGNDAVARFESIFREVCTQAVEDDGLEFQPSRIHGEQIREEQQYAGVRIRGVVLLGKARIPIQIDIGFGDIVTPEPQQVNYPSLLGLPAPVVQAYPMETVVSEKYEAMVALGMASSRMKDFYDIWVLATQFEFDGASLSRAIEATFQRRGTAIPSNPPLALTDEFVHDSRKQVQWQAFIKRGRLRHQTPAFEAVVVTLAGFLWPVTEAIARGSPFRRRWPRGGPWR